jgi:hypothetical protein
MVFGYFAGNMPLNQWIFPAKLVSSVFAGNALGGHQVGMHRSLG